MVSRHGAHKGCSKHGAHKGAHKGKACAHLVPSAHFKVMMRTKVRTRVCKLGAHKGVPPGAHKGVPPGVHKGARKALRRKGFLQSCIYVYTCTHVKGPIVAFRSNLKGPILPNIAYQRALHILTYPFEEPCIALSRLSSPLYRLM